MNMLLLINAIIPGSNSPDSSGVRNLLLDNWTQEFNFLSPHSIKNSNNLDSSFLYRGYNQLT